jgi:hypothetical protein
MPTFVSLLLDGVRRIASHSSQIYKIWLSSHGRRSTGLTSERQCFPAPGRDVALRATGGLRIRAGIARWRADHVRSIREKQARAALD